MKVFELSEEPLNEADKLRLKSKIEEVGTKLNRLKLFILAITLAALAVASFFYFVKSDVEAMNISFFVGALLAAIFGSIVLFGFDVVKSSKKVLKRNTKSVITGTITDKKIRKVVYKDSKGNSRSTTYIEFYFGPQKDINLPDRETYDTYKIGDKVKAYYDFERESILNNEIIEEVYHIELILKAEDNNVDLALFKLEDNEYNKQLKKHSIEKLEALSNKLVRMSAYDRKKLTKRFLKFMIINIVCIAIGILTFSFGLIGLIFIAFGVIFLILTIVKYVGDIIKNVKVIDVKQIDEIKRTGAKKYMNIIIKLSEKKKKTFQLKTREVDDYDFSHPVIVHRGGFSKNIFDLTFKTKGVN